MAAALRVLRRSYPFTLAGTLLLAAGIYLFGSGFMLENAYALLLGAFLPLLLALLAVLGRLQAIRLSRTRIRWDSSQTLIARRRDSAERVSVERVRTFPFYRLHLRVKGRLRVDGKAWLRVYREVATVGGETAVPLDLPLAGILSSVGSTAVRDVFGLTRASFGQDEMLLRPVLPEGTRELAEIPVTAVGGEEEQTRKSQQEVERYFMREYLPGDRARDINWKASSRLAQLITRISPYTQEKSQVIRIQIRPYRAPREPSLDSVMHLNRLKIGLMGFIRAVKREHPEYAFQVGCEETGWMLRSDDEIEDFARDLAGIFFRPDSGSLAPVSAGQLVIFTTPFDVRLPASLSSYGKSYLHIVTTSDADRRKPEAAEQVSLFELPWSAPRVDLPLPGRWAMRRERALSTLERIFSGGAGVAGAVTTEPLIISLFGKP